MVLELQNTLPILLTFRTPKAADYLTSYWMKFQVEKYNEKPRQCLGMVLKIANAVISALTVQKTTKESR